MSRTYQTASMSGLGQTATSLPKEPMFRFGPPISEVSGLPEAVYWQLPLCIHIAMVALTR
jgi:hypothetical protein